MNKIGWKSNQPCFYKIELKENIPKKYLNSSAREIKNKKDVSFLKRYIKKCNASDNINKKREKL